MAVRPLSNTVMGAALLAAGVLAGGVSSANRAQAEPIFCGTHEDRLNCSPQHGLPTSGETAFLTDVRGHVPGDDALLLATGRDICNMLKGGESVVHVVPQVASRLGVTNEMAGQVVDAATAYRCPGAPLNE